MYVCVCRRELSSIGVGLTTPYSVLHLKRRPRFHLGRQYLKSQHIGPTVPEARPCHSNCHSSLLAADEPADRPVGHFSGGSDRDRHTGHFARHADVSIPTAGPSRCRAGTGRRWRILPGWGQEAAPRAVSGKASLFREPCLLWYPTATGRRVPRAWRCSFHVRFGRPTLGDAQRGAVSDCTAACRAAT